MSFFFEKLHKEKGFGGKSEAGSPKSGVVEQNSKSRLFS